MARTGSRRWVVGLVAVAALAGCAPAGPSGGGGAAGAGAEVDLTQPLPCPVDPGSLGFDPVRWSAQDAKLRRGEGATRYSDLPTSKAVPAETCGALRSYELVARLACDDGSHPFRTVRQASAARVGNVGPGGRCGTIIDLYHASCPEAEYDLFVDMYHCAPGEDLR